MSIIYFWILVGLVLAYFVTVLIIGNKPKEYTIYMANNDVFQIYQSFRKSFLDYWWGFINFKGMRQYRDINGKKVWVSERFTLKIVEDEKPEERLKWIKEHSDRES